MEPNIIKKNVSLKTTTATVKNIKTVSPGEEAEGFPLDEDIPLVQKISKPLTIPGAFLSSSDSVFIKKNDNVLTLKNPHFVNIFCITPLVSPPECKNMIVKEKWITDSKYTYLSFIPSNSEGKSELPWGGSWPSNNLKDWRQGGDFEIIFPAGGLYWIESRGSKLLIETTVIDTRYISINPPSNLSVKEAGSQSVMIEWQDNSNNETAFHILIERMVGNKWIKLPFQRSDKNTNTIKWTGEPGYYRFAVRSALSVSEEKISFQRQVPSSNYKGESQTINIVTPSIIKYSEQTEWKNILISGFFPNPLPPTNFGGTTRADKSIFFVWQDNSNNETVFHILEDKFINGSWVRQQQIRVPENRISWTIPPKSTGKYRYCIRSAYSFPETNIIRTSSVSNWIEFTVP